MSHKWRIFQRKIAKNEGVYFLGVIIFEI